jgi:hypothetical protein
VTVIVHVTGPLAPTTTVCVTGLPLFLIVQVNVLVRCAVAVFDAARPVPED